MLLYIRIFCITDVIYIRYNISSGCRDRKKPKETKFIAFLTQLSFLSPISLLFHISPLSYPILSSTHPLFHLSFILLSFILFHPSSLYYLLLVDPSFLSFLSHLSSLYFTRVLWFFPFISSLSSSPFSIPLSLLCISFNFHPSLLFSQPSLYLITPLISSLIPYFHLPVFSHSSSLFHFSLFHPTSLFHPSLSTAVLSLILILLLSSSLPTFSHSSPALPFHKFLSSSLFCHSHLSSSLFHSSLLISPSSLSVFHPYLLSSIHLLYPPPKERSSLNLAPQSFHSKFFSFSRPPSLKNPFNLPHFPSLLSTSGNWSCFLEYHTTGWHESKSLAFQAWWYCMYI